jgi:hypothetical protein
MVKYFIFIFFISSVQFAVAQKQTYRDSILTYQQKYIKNLKVIGDTDRQFLRFYPADKSYRVVASFKRIIDTTGFDMNTSSGKIQKYFTYGLLTFKLNDTIVQLHVYQSAALMKKEKLKDYLFVPFGDATSGFESYGGGRYMEFFVKDIKNNKVILDFNKAYNPYCAYTTGYNCPIPPMENLLKVAVRAGEKDYAKPVH